MGDHESENEPTPRPGTGKPQKGSFIFYEAEGDTCAKMEKWEKAVEAYSEALVLKPTHVRTLLSRSTAYTHVGRPDLSLKDADAVLALNAKDFRGLYAKAEALFAAGDFEYALMFYHRGNHLRPSDEFRLGIQKSEQAIRDSIAQEKLPPPTAVPGGRSTQRSLSPSLTDTVRSSLSRSGVGGGFTSLDMVKDQPPPSKRQSKKLLGEMFADREYLQQLAADTGLGDIATLASGGLKYLDTRTEFWRQQNPPDPDRAATASSGSRGMSRPGTQLSRTTLSRNSMAAYEQSRAATSQSGGMGGGATSPQPKQRAASRQKYLEQTRYAIQTLENVNAAIEYGDPELGLKFAKGFLSRLATLDIPDKPRILGNLYSCMGITYMELGKLTLAAIHHRKDLDIAVKYNYKDAYLRALGNLGQVYQRMGDFSQAIAMYEKKLMFGDENEAPRLCECIGRCYLDAGDTENAIRFAERAINAAEVVSDGAQLIVAYLLHGHALSVAGQHTDAVGSFERCLSLAREQGDITAQANALTHLGNAYLQMGDVQRSIELQQQALELSAQLNQQPVDAQQQQQPQQQQPVAAAS